MSRVDYPNATCVALLKATGIWKPLPAAMVVSLLVFLFYDVTGSLSSCYGYLDAVGRIYVVDYPPLAAAAEILSRPWSFWMFAPLSYILRLALDFPFSTMQMLLARGVSSQTLLKSMLMGLVSHACTYWLPHCLIAIAAASFFCTGSYDIEYLADLYNGGASIFVEDAHLASASMCVGSYLLVLAPVAVSLSLYLLTGSARISCLIPAALALMRLYGFPALYSMMPGLTPYLQQLNEVLNSLFSIVVQIEWAFPKGSLAIWAGKNMLLPVVALCFSYWAIMKPSGRRDQVACSKCRF